MIISALYPPDVIGGAELVLQLQAEALQRRGHDVCVLTLSEGDGLSVGEVNGVNVWRAGVRNRYFHFYELRSRKHSRTDHLLWHVLDSYNWRMKEYVTDVVEQFRPDIACCHNLSGWSIAAWSALNSRDVPIVQVLHDQYLLCANTTMFRNGKVCQNRCLECSLLRLPHRRSSCRIDAVVGVSDFILRKLHSNGYFAQSLLSRVIYNVEKMDGRDVPASARPDDGKVAFGYIGRLTEAKGIEFLLQTFIKCREQHWELSIAGTGEEHYAEYLQSTYGAPGIRFLGHTEAAEFFPSVDITVVPSHWEDTLPSVVYQSLLYGKPVLGSRVGGIPEMLSETTGRLFQAGDENDLRQSLRAMAADLDAIRSRCLAIQLEARPYRDEARWISRWVETFEDTIALRRARNGPKRSISEAIP